MAWVFNAQTYGSESRPVAVLPSNQSVAVVTWNQISCFARRGCSMPRLAQHLLTVCQTANFQVMYAATWVFFKAMHRLWRKTYQNKSRKEEVDNKQCKAQQARQQKGDIYIYWYMIYELGQIEHPLMYILCIIYICIYTHIYLNMYIYMYVCMYVCIYIYMYLHIYIYVYIYIHTHISVPIRWFHPLAPPPGRVQMPIGHPFWLVYTAILHKGMSHVNRQQQVPSLELSLSFC